MFVCSLCGDKFDRIHMCREPEGLTDMRLECPAPADRRIIAWMPTAYMEAARAAQGEPDALAILGAGADKPVDLVCTCPDCVDGPEAKPEPECGVWLISPTSLPASMRSGPENGKGKAKGREMVYDFEEVP